jgi:S-DNA-T family DNA segregation ATPase FtsK/SpoIIIE
MSTQPDEPLDDEPRDDAEVIDIEEGRRRRTGTDTDDYEDGPDDDSTEVLTGRVVEHQGERLPGTDLAAPDDDSDDEDDGDADGPVFRATVRVVRLVIRQPAYVAGGAKVTGRRYWESRTTARHERMMRAAEAQGDYQAILEWEERARAFRAERHERRMAMLAAPVHAARALAVTAIAGTGLLLALGIALAVSERKPRELIGPFLVTVDVVRTTVAIASVLWVWVLILAPAAALLALWQVGRSRQELPTWLMAPAQADDPGRDLIPDEGAILNALRNLGIPALNRKFKEGWQPRWVTATERVDGIAYRTQILLPEGVPVEEINKKKPVLAHNLLRHPADVWLTEPRNQPGVLDLYVADQNSLSGPVPPWPLLKDGRTDFFKGVPVGVSQRRAVITARLMAANYMIGGIMGVGKSSLVIALLLGAMLDPLVEIEVYVMAFNVDYDPMRERLRVLVKGDEDEQILGALQALRALRDEVTQRGKLLEKLGGEEVVLTRAIAERDPRMRPKIVVFDECHELFMHKKYGPEAAELAVKVMKKARKTGITLIFVTVSPGKDSIPKDVTRNTSHRAAFAVGDHFANDGILGSGKHKAGITATTLSPTEDIGTALTVGFTRNPFELLRCCHIRKEAGRDEITPVVRRALALREQEGITGQDTAPAQDDTPARDLLADLAHLLGTERRMRTTIALQRLAALAPATYEGWTGETLKAALTDIDPHLAPHRYDGYPVVDASKIRAALGERAEQTPLQDENDQGVE